MFDAGRRQRRRRQKSRPSPTKLSGRAPRLHEARRRADAELAPDGIRQLLDARHLGHVAVRSAKLEQTSKAAILKELLDAQDARFANRPIPGTHGVRAVYADDDVHELCEEGVAALARAGRVVRVLFAPGGVGS